MKLGIKNSILIILFISLGAILIMSGTKMIQWIVDHNHMNKQLDKIEEITTISEIDIPSETIPQEEVLEDDPYWKYIGMSLINVDFEELKQMNDSTIGWLQVNGTNINYPFVQGADNDYYLTHSFDKSNNSGGWVFLDYRNNPKELDKNTIIYGHSRSDTTMFGSLKKILSNGWLDNSDNYVIKLSTEYENTLWQVFSVYHIPTTSDYLQIDFITDQEFLNFANMLLDRSAYDFQTKIQATDKILTLSTCYGKTDKVVLHAKLIKQHKK